MSKEVVRQEGNQVGGDQAGGNITKNYYNSGPVLGAIARWNEQYMEERKAGAEDAATREMDARLRHYAEPILNETVAGLETKLAAGGFSFIAESAVASKEKFAMLVANHSHSESAQNILAYLLANIAVSFQHQVYPLLCNGGAASQVLSAVHEKVIEPAVTCLGSNVLDLFPDDVAGALYFLTGNCHVKWTR